MPLDADPRYTARLIAAREGMGLSQEALAAQAGLPKGFLWDLEAYPDDIVSAVSLRDLAAVCRVLRIEPAELFAPDGAAFPVPVRPQQLADAVQAHMTAAGLTPDTFAELVGWNITGLLADPPTAVAALNVDGLYDICAAASVPWLAALPTDASVGA